jgi:membrane fusion protein (multidrug efflux system)
MRSPDDSSLSENGNLSAEQQPSVAIADEGPPPAATAPLHPLRRRRILFAGLAVALVLIIALGLLIVHLAKTQPRVVLYTVHEQTLNSYVGGGGLTYAARTLNVAYPVSGRVMKVAVSVGQAVQAGQPLLTLDNATIAAQLEQAYVQLQTAQNYLNTLLAQPVPPTANGAAQHATAIAAARRVVAIAQSHYDALNAQLSSPAYNHGTVTAPFTGVVTAINVTAGTLFSANKTLLTLQDISTIVVQVQFPLAERAQVRVGASAQVDPVAAPGQQFTGTVTAIVPALSSAGSATFTAWVTVPNNGQQLFTGESVYVRVASQQQLPTVPELAVINPDADSIVFVYANGRAHVRHVVVGLRDGDRFGIISGLQPGDQVILVGQYQLSDNEPVVVVGKQS